MILKRRKLFFTVAVAMFSMFLLTGCFDQSYEPAKIDFFSPANSEVLPAGTEFVTIHGKVTKGEEEIKGLYQVGINTNGLEEFTSVAFDENGEFLFDFYLAPIPDGVTRTFETSTCTFEVRDANLKANRERISFTVAQFPVHHGDISMKDEAMAGISLTEEFIDETIPYINAWVQELMPGMIDDMIGEVMTVEMDYPFSDMYVTITDLEVGNIALDINFQEGGWTDIASFQMTPNLDGSKAMLVSTLVDWPPLIWDLPVTFSVTSLGVENVNLQIKVDATNTIIIKADLADIDVYFDGGDLKIWGQDLLPDAVEDMILPMVMDMIRKVFKTIEIPPMPLLNESDLVLEDLLDSNVDIAIGLPGEETYITTDDAMAMRLGLVLDITDWNESLPAYFVGTPGDEMPDIMAYPDDVSDEDLVVAVSDDMINQAMYVLVHSGFLETMLSKISIGDLLGNIAPELLKYSPDLEILLSIPTPPICNFAAQDPNELADFGEFSITNMIVEIKNLQLFAKAKPETYRFSLDAENVPIRLGLHEKNGVQVVQAETDINIDEVNFEILYTTLPIARLGNIVIKLAKDIFKKILDDDVIPIVISMEVPDLDLPLPAPMLTLLSESTLQDNYLVLKLDVEFPDLE